MATISALAVVAAGCGGSDDGGASGDRLAVGTTDKVISFDPAGSYDQGSWTIVYNTYQNLMRIAPGGTTPEPDAAKSCDFENDTTYVCTLRDGLTFHDGSDLTAEDVKFSLERVVNIEDPNGPSTLLANMKSIEAPDDTTVRITLKEPDSTFPFALTTGAGAIVPSDTYPADKLQPSDKLVGSGPYKMVEYEDGQRLVLDPFDGYKGPAPMENEGAIVQYYAQPSALKLAVEQADVSVAYRSLSPTDVADLEKNNDVEVVEGEGTEIRYIVFNVKLDPAKNLAVRQALAQSIDRQSIADNVYNGTVKPLYSMLPEGIKYAQRNFADKYGEQPDVDGAKQTLQKAGVTTPVDVELWWTPTHYGAVSADEFTEIKRQLDETGLFKVTLKSAEWQQYSTASTEDGYATYQLGWFPDFPDPDNFASPFFVDGGFYNNHYSNKEMNALIAEERSTTDPAAREKAFTRIQEIAAEDVPTIPLWQGKQIAVTGKDVKGVKDTLDPSFTFRMYMVSQG
ncbi:MAG: ABC transporter substrate-binding protein [Actinomycetes bacterium]